MSEYNFKINESWYGKFYIIHYDEKYYPYTYLTSKGELWQSTFRDWKESDYCDTREQAQQIINEYNMKNEKIPTDLGKQIELAKSLIGETIYSLENPDVCGVVDSYKISDEIFFTSKLNTERFSKVLKKQPVVVELKGTWNDNVPMGYILVPGDSFPKIRKPVVKVNGCEAKEDGEFYFFGCAMISKENLKEAKLLLSRQSKSAGNRKIESVKIGKGDFTLEILEQLNLD